VAIINPEDVEGAPGGYGAGDERIAALEAELARARAYNGKEYIEALNKHISNLDADRTQARAERDAARRALGKALDGWYDATILLLQTGVSHEDVTVRNRNKCNEARAAIKAAEKGR